MPKRKKGSSKTLPTINDDGYPTLSILTPIYDRNIWLPLMIANIKSFDYDTKKMSWDILDSKDGESDTKLFNSPEEITQVQIDIYPIKLNYTYIPRKMTIAEKRNWLCKNMKNKWFANLDSDDIYFDTYLKYSIDMCKKNKVQLAGSPQMIFCHVHHDFKITAIQCEAERQAHEGTFVGTKKYVASMGGFSKNDKKGEGAGIIDGNEQGIVKTECSHCMICISHNNNTCSKDLFLETNNQNAKLQGDKFELLKEILKDEILAGRNDHSQFKSLSQK
jgi:hypothetical protein